MAADLEFRVNANLAEFRSALASIRDELRSVTADASRVGASRPLDNLDSGARSAATSVGRLVAGFVSLAAAIRLIGAADELNTLNARLQIATNSVQEFERAQVALFELAQRSRASLTETADLYSRIALATQDAGLGQETLLEVVETINQAVQLSGTSAQAANAALIQLGQGLGSGTLRGEELNSVLEQTPVLADAIARGMGITRGELRKYGEEGKITAQAVIEALQRQRNEIAGQFERLPVTVGQAVTLTRNAGLALLGAFDQSSTATSTLAGTIQRFAALLSSESVRGAVVEFGVTVRQYFELAAQAAQGAVQTLSAALDTLAGTLNATIGAAIGSLDDFSGTVLGLPRTVDQAIALIVRAFRELPANIRASIQIVTVQATALLDRIVSQAQLTRDRFSAIFSDDTQTAALARYRERNRIIEEAARGSIDSALAEREVAIAQAEDARRQAEEARRRGQQPTTRGTGRFRASAASGTGDGKAAEAARKAELDALERLQDDATKRELSILREQFDSSALAAEDYYQRRRDLEVAGIDQAIAAERQRAAAGGAERIKALADIELLERRRADVERASALERDAFRRNLDRQREQAGAALAQASGNPVEAARIRAEAQYRDLLSRLTAEGDAAGVQLIRKLIDTELVDAQLQELQRRISTGLADLRGQEALIAAQADAGLLPQLESERQLTQLRVRSIEQLRQYRDALVAVAQAQTANGGIADPRVTQQITQLDTEIARVTASQRRLQTQIEQAGASALANLFTDLATGARGFSDAVRAAALSFVQSIARMAAEALAKRAILALVSGGTAGGAGAGGIFAGLFHGGGMVGRTTGPGRMVNPLVFAGAPRFHSGGMVGLRPDERPAILQTGEEVLSRTDPRNAGNGGGSGYRIVNVLDPSLVSDYLDSSAGERTVLNLIGRNPGQVRQLLGA
jgi:tape measure domain-containing protein